MVLAVLVITVHRVVEPIKK